MWRELLLSTAAIASRLVYYRARPAPDPLLAWQDCQPVLRNARSRCPVFTWTLQRPLRRTVLLMATTVLKTKKM